VRPRTRAICGVALAIATAAAGGVSATGGQTRAPALQAIDSLLNAARYGSAGTLTIASIGAAEARGDSAAVGALAFRLGRLSVTLGHQAIARRELDRAIRLTAASRDTSNLARALIFRGFVHRDMGEIDAAMELFQRALDLSQRAHIASSQAEATYNLAYRDLRRGNLEAARPGYVRAMALWRSTRDPFQIAAGAGALGNLYTVLGEVDSARYWYHRSLDIARQHDYPFHELWALNNLGDLGRRTGNYEAAIDYYRGALAIGRRIGFDRGTALPAMNMALALSYLGQRDLAFQYLDECEAVCRRAGFKDLEVANTIVAGVLCLEAGYNGRASAFFRKIVNQGYVYDTNRRNEAAYGLSLALAEMDSLEQAIAVLEPYVSPRAKAAHGMGQPYFELGYVGLLRRAGRYDEALVRIRALQQGPASGSGLGVEARLLESSCRRHLGDHAGAARALAAALDSLEVERMQIRQADVREAYGLHIMRDVIDGCRVLLEYPAATPRSEREHNFYDALQRFKTRTLLERIDDPRGGNPLDAGGGVARPVTVSRLQASVLQPGELLLDMVVSRDTTFMFAVTVDSCRMVALPGSHSDLEKKALLFAALLSEPSAEVRGAYPIARMNLIQRTMGKIMIDPVADMVASARRVIFAPDGFYTLIPPGTLVMGANEVLLASKDVMEVPSASVLAWARATHGAKRANASMVVVTDESSAAPAGVRREAGYLRRHYANVEVVPARAGVLDTLSRRARPDRVLHIAAHARVNDASPWHSGFVLATAGDIPNDSVPADSASQVAFLRAWEIARARLPFAAAVLSGCETAGGRSTTGEGVLGLTSAFLSAGVPVVVSSRWAVDDDATAKLMEQFYRGMARGMSPAAALRDAQLDMRRHPHTQHPFYWAGFSVSGDGARVVVPMRAHHKDGLLRWLVVLAGVVAVVAGILQFHRRRRVPVRGIR